MAIKTPEISVIVPVYKVEPYLRQCVDSILAQTFTDFELILVDDGSPDNCSAICDEYAEKDDRIIVIHQQNQGLSAARNAGMEIMRGEYVMFVDSDDMIHPCAFEMHYNNIKAYDADVSKSFPLLFEKMEELAVEQYAQTSIRTVTGRDACFELYEPNGWFYTVTDKLYRTSFFKELRFPIGLHYEDEAIIYKVYYFAKTIVEMDAQLYYYRKNPSGIMRQDFSLKRYDRVTVFLDRYHFFCDENEEELAQLAKQIADIYKAKYAITSRKAGVYSSVVPQYKMSICDALKSIKANCSEQNYEWWLKEVHPFLLYAYIYWRKIKSILHVK